MQFNQKNKVIFLFEIRYISGNLNHSYFTLKLSAELLSNEVMKNREISLDLFENKLIFLLYKNRLLCLNIILY